MKYRIVKYPQGEYCVQQSNFGSLWDTFLTTRVLEEAQQYVKEDIQLRTSLFERKQRRDSEIEVIEEHEVNEF